MTMTTLLRTSIFVAIGAIPFCLLFHYFFASYFWFPEGVVAGLVISIPLDKFYDGKYRKLKKHEAPDAGGTNPGR